MSDTKRVSHEEWVHGQRSEALEVARAIRSGRIGVVEGSRRLIALREGVESPALEELFSPFDAIDSQTDHLPIGDQLGLWAPDVVATKRAQLAEAESVHRQTALDACAALIECLEQDV